MQKSPRHTDVLGNGFALAILIAPFLYWPTLSEFANLPQAAWLQVATFFCLSIFFLRRKQETAINSSPLLIPIAALLLWCFAGLSYAVNPYELIKRFIHLMGAAAAFVLVIQLYRTTSRTKILLWALAISGLGVALIGIAQHLFNLSVIPQLAPPSATFANKNMAAHFVVLTIPAAITLFLIEKKRFPYLLPIMIALQATFLAYARTRASWLALFVELSLLALFFLRFRKNNSLLQISNKQKKGLLLGIVLVILFTGLGKQASFSGYKNILSRLEQSQSYVKEPGRQVRFAFWLNTLAMTKDHPVLGVGLGNFKSYYPLYHHAILKDPSFSLKMQAVDSHNDLLQGLAELGIVGGGLFLWLTIGTLISVKQGLDDTKDNRQIIAVCATTGLFAFMVISLFSFPMACSMPPFLAALYLGLLATQVTKQRKREPTNRKMRTYGLLSVVIFLAVALFNFKDLKADHFLLKFIDMEHQQNWPAALESGQKAVAALPIRYQIFAYLGRAFLRTGNLPQAEKSYLLALTTSPADINTMTNLGQVYLQENRYQQAREILEKSIAIYPENWAAYSNMGSIYMRQGEYEEAKENFGKATQIEGKSKRLWFNLGEAAHRSGDQKTAIKAYEEALTLDPEWRKAEKKLLEAKKQKNLP